MGQIHIPLESISVASPCRADWNRMAGDDRARFCQTCQKNVYNLSDMSRAEAEALIREKEGKLCVRFYRRDDGTVLTADCPVGLRVVQRPFKWLAAGAAMLLASGVALATGHDPVKQCLPKSPSGFSWQHLALVRMVTNWLNPPPPQPIGIMGAISVPPPPVPTPAPTATDGTAELGEPVFAVETSQNGEPTKKEN